MKRFTSLVATVSMVAVGSVFLLTSGVAGASSPSTTGTLPVLTLALNGTSVTVGGSTVSGATTITTTVTGEKQGEPTLFRLNTGIPFADFAQAVQMVGAHHGDLNYLDPYGSLVYNASAPSGTSSGVVNLAPGNYFALDTQGNGNPPHAQFTVTTSSAPAAMPTPDATVSTIEFGFTGPKTLHEGENVLWQNLGFLVHMDVYAKAKNRAAAKKIADLLLLGKDKLAGKLAVGGGTFAGPISSGAAQESVVTAAPGWYVQACFMDTQDGREHTELGMERVIRITK